MNAFSEAVVTQECRLIRRLNHRLRYKSFCDTMVFASRLGDGAVWYTMLVIVVWWQGLAAWRGILAGALATTVCVALFKTLKLGTARLRPFEVMTDLRTALPPIDEWSFPSGHAMNAFSVSVVITVFYGSLAIVVWPCALVIALSRVALGLHYPSDVLVGAMLGAVIAALSAHAVLLAFPY